jgi:hypothetical protein
MTKILGKIPIKGGCDMREYEAYERLAAGIVEQSARDYLNVKRNLYFCEKHHVGFDFGGRYSTYDTAIKNFNAEMETLRKFFHSDWCYMLVPGIDADYLIEKLDKHFEEEKENEDYQKWEQRKLLEYDKKMGA